MMSGHCENRAACEVRPTFRVRCIRVNEKGRRFGTESQDSPIASGDPECR